MPRIGRPDPGDPGFTKLGKRIHDAWKAINVGPPNQWLVDLTADLNIDGKYFNLRNLDGSIIQVIVSMDPDDDHIRIHLPRKPTSPTEYDSHVKNLQLGKAVIYGCGK